MNVYVGNLNQITTEDQLRTLFSPFGEIKSLQVVKDTYTYKSRGFAFVEMTERNAGEEAVHKLNNIMLDQQFLTINEARNRNNYEHSIIDRNLKRRY